MSRRLRAAHVLRDVHGVELLRAFTLGDVGPLVLVNVAYLVAMMFVFLVLADRRLGKLLLK